MRTRGDGEEGGPGGGQRVEAGPWRRWSHRRGPRGPRGEGGVLGKSPRWRLWASSAEQAKEGWCVRCPRGAPCAGTVSSQERSELTLMPELGVDKVGGRRWGTRQDHRCQAGVEARVWPAGEPGAQVPDARKRGSKKGRTMWSRGRAQGPGIQAHGVPGWSDSAPPPCAL